MRQFINEQQIYETWAPIIQRTTEIKDKDRLTWMSMLAQTQRLYEDRRNIAHVNPNMNINGMGALTFPGNPSYTYNFPSQSPGSGDKPYTLLPLAMQVAAQTIGLDLVPVVPMPGPMGMLTYLDFVYAGGKLDSKEAPLVIKVPIAIPTGGSALVAGTSYYVATGGAGTGLYQFTYIGKSRLDGFSIFRVRATETDGVVRPYGAPADQDINYAVSNGSLFDAVGGTEVATFDGTADLVKALEDHIEGYVGRSLRLGDGATNRNEAYLREEGESEPANLMGLKLKSKSVEAQTYQVAAAVTQEQVDDLRQYGIDAMGQLEAILSNEMTQTINKLVLERMFKMGASSATKWYESQGENFNINLNSSDSTIYLGAGIDGNQVSGMLTKSVNTSLGGESVATLQRKVLTMALGSSNAINNHTRRGNGNFIVTNHQVATAIQSIAGFTEYPMSNTINQAAGSLYNLGSISGINVYVDPNMGWSDTRVLVGRKGDANSTGLVFMPYLMAQSTSVIAESTMAPKLQVKSRFSLVDAGHYPEDNYSTFKVNLGDVLPTLLG